MSENREWDVRRSRPAGLKSRNNPHSSLDPKTLHPKTLQHVSPTKAETCRPDLIKPFSSFKPSRVRVLRRIESKLTATHEVPFVH